MEFRRQKEVEDMRLSIQTLVFCWLVLFMFLNGCTEDVKDETDEPIVANYFPLSVGSNWTYRLEDGSESTVSITEKREISGNTYYNFKGKPVGNVAGAPDSLYRVTSEGMKIYAGEFNDFFARSLVETFKEEDVEIEELEIKSSPTDELLWLKFPLEVGGKWNLVRINISFKMVYKEENISVDFNLVVTMKASVVGSETITTPAGTFNNAIKVTYEFSITGTFEMTDSLETIWFAEGVGVIQSEDEDGLEQLVRYDIK